MRKRLLIVPPASGGHEAELLVDDSVQRLSREPTLGVGDELAGEGVTPSHHVARQVRGEASKNSAIGRSKMPCVGDHHLGLDESVEQQGGARTSSRRT